MVMAMRRAGRMLVAVQSTVPPTDAEWQSWLQLCADHRGAIRALVEAHGNSGPNAMQRKQLAEVVATLDVRTAILTNSLVTRGVVTAIAWFGIALRAFPLGGYAAASTYLQLSEPEIEEALSTLAELREESGLTRRLASND
jgi:hypothetical protein